MNSNSPTLAAVLVPLLQREHGTTVLFTVRSDQVAHHKGQISFPGGTIEPHDQDLVATALRETEEEIGLPQHAVDVIKVLPGGETRTGFHITPVLAKVSPPYQFNLSSEVSEVFEVPLTYLLELENYQKEHLKFEQQTFESYVIQYQDYRIWGATAIIAYKLAIKHSPCQLEPN